MYHVLPIPCLTDNYAWALFEHPDASPPRQVGAECVVVDPGEAAPVSAALAGRGLALAAIWLTHHHHDHTGGARALVAAAAPGRVEVVGAAVDRPRLPPLTRAIGDGDRWRAGSGEVVALAVPGHTRGAIAFYLAAADAVWTGDTLFTGGCGRLMEGDAAQMQISLSRLAGLPPATRVFCGHEYTARNLDFALTVLPEDPALAARRRRVALQRERGLPTVPATLAEELESNLFLRTDEPGLRAAVGAGDGAAAFAEIRSRRDRF